jgi:DNA-binding transcriptional LysR family regulator
MNFRNLDLNLLRVFEAVHSENSITLAAEKLGLTQPAVSNALNRLRQHLDDPLFERGAGGMVPTPMARRIAPVLAEALDALERSLGGDNEFDPYTNTREFKMMMPEALEPMLMHPLLEHVSKMPGLTFELLPVNYPGHKDLVLSRQADLAIYPGSFNDEAIRSTLLCSMEISLVVRKDHPIYGKGDRFTGADFFEAGFVVLGDEIRRSVQYHQEAAATGQHRRMVCKATRMWSALLIAASTDLVAAVPDYLGKRYAKQLGLKVFPMPIPAAPEQCHMGWHAQFSNDPAHMWLRETLKRIAEPYRARITR